nr:hypothetical protein [Phytoactinopolyspora limicola]
MVAVGWPAGEVSVGGLGEVSHGVLDALLDAHPFALGHSAEEGHYQVVCFTAGVDPTADLRDPEADSVVREHWERQGELCAVEGALRFADHEFCERSSRVGDVVEQPCRLRASLPRQRT